MSSIATINDDLQASYNILNLLEQSNASVEGILDQLPGIFLIINQNNEILRSNLAVVEMLGVDNEDIWREQVSILFKNNTWPTFKGYLERLRSPAYDSDTIHFELGVLHERSRTLKEHYWFLTKLEISSSAEGQLIAIIGEDISELRKAIRKKMGDLHTLNITGEVLAGQHDQTETLKTALKVLEAQINVSEGSVYLLKDGQLEFTACHPESAEVFANAPKTFQLGEGIAGKVAQERRIIYIPDVSKNASFLPDDAGSSDHGALLCVPMMDDQGVFGVMNFTGRTESIHFDEEDEEFAMTIARMAVVSTKNIQMLQVIEEHNRTLEQKVLERTSAIKDLMDNTGQGFFTFGNDYLIWPEYSKPCQLFFNGPIEGKNAMELLFSNPNENSGSLKEKFDSGELEQYFHHEDSVRELLDLIFNGIGDIEILGEMLPKESVAYGRILAVEFRFLSSGNEERFMVILTDVTVERQLAAKVAAEEQYNNMIIKVARDRDGFLQFLREKSSLFLSIYTLLANPAHEINCNELFRYFHTIKGGTASYGLNSVAEKTHEIEADLEEVRNGNKPLTESGILLLLEKTQDLQQVFSSACVDLNIIIPIEEQKQSERVYKIKDDQFAELETTLSSMFPVGSNELERINQALSKIRKQPIGPMLVKYAATAEGLAERLDKKVDIEVSGKDVLVSYEPKLEAFFGALVHLVRNCVDHGLEEPAVRVMCSKPETGTLKIQASEAEQMLKLVIADDGGGVDANVIKGIALKKGLITAEYAESASEQELVLLILAPGFSTKEEVSDISGRGVGMDAVKEALDQLGGSIQIHTVLGEGTTFEIEIPQ